MFDETNTTRSHAKEKGIPPTRSGHCALRTKLPHVFDASMDDQEKDESNLQLKEKIRLNAMANYWYKICKIWFMEISQHCCGNHDKTGEK